MHVKCVLINNQRCSFRPGETPSRSISFCKTILKVRLVSLAKTDQPFSQFANPFPLALTIFDILSIRMIRERTSIGIGIGTRECIIPSSSLGNISTSLSSRRKSWCVPLIRMSLIVLFKFLEPALHLAHSRPGQIQLFSGCRPRLVLVYRRRSNQSPIIQTLEQSLDGIHPFLDLCPFFGIHLCRFQFF